MTAEHHSARPKKNFSKPCFHFYFAREFAYWKYCSFKANCPQSIFNWINTHKFSCSSFNNQDAALSNPIPFISPSSSSSSNPFHISAYNRYPLRASPLIWEGTLGVESYFLNVFLIPLFLFTHPKLFSIDPIQIVAKLLFYFLQHTIKLFSQNAIINPSLIKDATHATYEGRVQYLRRVGRKGFPT